MFEMLTIREKEVFNQVIACKSDKDIANNLSVTAATVKTHLGNIYNKFGLSGQYARMHLLKLYYENHLASLGKQCDYMKYKYRYNMEIK